MRLNAQVLDQMRGVDIGAVSPEALPDVSNMAFNNSLTREERIVHFLRAVKKRAVLTGHADQLSAPAEKRAVTSVTARCYFETKCPEAESSLLSRPGRVII